MLCLPFDFASFSSSFFFWGGEGGGLGQDTQTLHVIRDLSNPTLSRTKRDSTSFCVLAWRTPRWRPSGAAMSSCSPRSEQEKQIVALFSSV